MITWPRIRTHLDNCEGFIIQNVVLFQGGITARDIALQSIEVMLDQDIQHDWPNLEADFSRQRVTKRHRLAQVAVGWNVKR